MDISSSWGSIINRADISDKWSPLAGPGGWNGALLLLQLLSI